MPAKCTFTFPTGDISSRLRGWQARLESKLTAEWPKILAACIMDIVSRAPTPIDEYNYIQGYTGGNFLKPRSRTQKMHGAHLHLPLISGVMSVPVNAHMRHRKGTAPVERIPFIRTPGTWIIDAVQCAGVNHTQTGNGLFSMSLGHVKKLEELTKFSWANASNKLGQVYHTSEYGVWSFFEYGLPKTQKPRAQWTRPGKEYTLKPYGVRDPSFYGSEKHYPRCAMYSGFDTDKFRTAIVDVVRSVNF